MLAEQIRSGAVETTHHGAVAIVDRHGQLVAHTGDIARPFFFRSAAKPFQAAMSQAHGAGLRPEELALASASHDGEAVHLALVESMLADAGLSETDLRCPPDWPIRPAAGRRLAGRGEREPRRLFHNCSGKHAAMLRASLASGWPLDTYHRPDHQLQNAIFEFMAEVAGVDKMVGIDGCGVPVFLTNTLGMARAFARLAVEQALADVFSAIHSYPGLVSGVANADAAISRHLDAAAKRGAMGTMGVAVRQRFGLAVKCWDGSDRVAGVAAIGALDELRVVSVVANDRLEPFRRPLVYGGEDPVGALESRLELKWS
ncbi:MAG TPA: asparaginase [Acidimicrobiia bacterium]|nr:asparaginase [Acidimicrobiia bacterium]